MSTPAEIERLHRALDAQLAAASGTRIAIRAPDEHWRSIARKDVRVYFAAYGEPAHYSPMDRGASATPCFSLALAAPGERRLWWAWREEWKSTAIESLALVGAGFVFFWGDDVSRAQVFRAEWDDPAHRGEEVGQPHWHIDDAILAEAWRRPTAIRASGSGLASASALAASPVAVVPADEAPPLSHDTEALADYDAIESLGEAATIEPADYASLESTAVSIVSVSGMHLYMGGWGNQPDPPGCYHATLDYDRLVHWAGRTLTYVRREAERIDDLG